MCGGGVIVPLIFRILQCQGDASFWWNLKRSDNGDESTRQAGCTVLGGEGRGGGTCTRGLLSGSHCSTLIFCI